MPSSERNTPQRPIWQQWSNPHSCAVGCLGYVAGILTLPIIPIVEFEYTRGQKAKVFRKKD